MESEDSWVGRGRHNSATSVEPSAGRGRQISEYWMEKFEVDTDAKSAELTQLKADKEKDLRTLQELARTYDDYEVITRKLKSQAVTDFRDINIILFSVWSSKTE